MKNSNFSFYDENIWSIIFLLVQMWSLIFFLFISLFTMSFISFHLFHFILFYFSLSYLFDLISSQTVRRESRCISCANRSTYLLLSVLVMIRVCQPKWMVTKITKNKNETKRKTKIKTKSETSIKIKNTKRTFKSTRRTIRNEKN